MIDSGAVRVYFPSLRKINLKYSLNLAIANIAPKSRAIRQKNIKTHAALLVANESATRFTIGINLKNHLTVTQGAIFVPKSYLNPGAILLWAVLFLSLTLVTLSDFERIRTKNLQLLMF